MNSAVVKFWAAILAFIGVSLCTYKSLYLGLPLTAENQTEVWTVQAQLSFRGNGGPAQIGLYVPEVTPGFLALDEDFISGRFGLAVEADGDNRRADWSIRRAHGMQTLYYRTVITQRDLPSDWGKIPRFPAAPVYPEPFASAIKAITDNVRNESADVATYTRELLLQLNSTTPNENVALIRGRTDYANNWVSEIIDVLKVARIPARTLWGLRVVDAVNRASLESLLQVHNGAQWLTFDPITAKPGIPDNFFVWQVGEKPLVHIKGGVNAELNFSVTKTYEELIDVAMKGASRMDSVFASASLMSLPVQSQNIYRLLLMVPLGALVVVFMRTFVGLRTFGTFMPILIALAFRETQLMWGIVFFTLIVSLGLMVRFYLEQLMLLLIPRLASILTVVVIIMLLISMVSSQLGAERVLSVALFPMVIMAMTIERMSICWEESGAKEAMTQGLGSLLIACIGYLVMTNDALMYIMFVFPELLLVVLSLSLLMGRYTGYRLSELSRFRAMLKQDNG